ncbi:class I SAM-dependent methyltransferase [Candidatus Pelagibacter sp.]|jgi:ubiquinone/menaquinone biosynthesis C-methylase UbiE|nr:class I SAM-dependent methyltransferase [Candidatus Pelagibacter sp.]
MTEQINKDYLKEKQYKTTQYLEARIKIHSFTENKQSFHQWLYDQYDFSNFKDKKIKVLDVACGTGVFWKQNFDKFKDFDIDLTMTDFADSMLEKSQVSLKDYKFQIKYEIADIEKLEKYKNQFDIVFCHNAVYHAENKDIALNNLLSCLNDDNNSFASITTNSEKHMLNVYEIGRSLDPKFPTDRIIDSFTEELADEMLPKYFKVDKKLELEKLKVTDLEILMNYVASGVEPRNIKLKDSFYDEYSNIAKKEIDTNGYFEIIKRSPLYICKKLS